jgi:opacity protein-like surface antigen
VNLVKLVFLTVLIAVCVTTAHASDVNGYIGISAGQSEFNDACRGCDDTDTAGKVFMGMHKNYFGVETAFVWFGEAPTPTKDSADNMFGVQIQGVGRYSVNDQFSGFAKIGGLVYEGDEIDSDVTWALGAGIQYNFKYGFGIRAEYEWFSDIDSVGDTSLISAGLVFNFD